MPSPRKYILHLKALKARGRAIRPRKPHRRGQRMRAFGVNKKRYLFMIPLLLAAIVLAGFLKAPPVAVNRFRPQDPSQVNPLMGWAPDAADESDHSIPHSLVYATLTWRDFEPEEGVYDFASFEEKNHLEMWWAQGKQLILRFVMDAPGGEDHLDIPDWLYEQMGDSAGCAYENSLGKGFSPNYNSRLLQSRHERALSQLGARYDRHAGVAFIEMGSLGHNGGWTVESVPDEWAMPPASDLLSWAWQYASAFPNTPILMSAPYQPARVLGLGLYNDHLGDPDKGWAWLDTIEYGGYDSGVGAELRALPGALLSAPSGAHIAGDADQARLFGEGVRALLGQLSLSHTTYVAGLDAGAVGENTAALRVARSVMGYQLWVREARFAARTRCGYRLRVELDLRNDGVQPFSQDWPVELSLIRDGRAVYTQTTQLDIRTITTGAHKADLALDIPPELEGEYALGLAILHPDTLEPAVALCMDGARLGLRHILGTLTILS